MQRYAGFLITIHQALVEVGMSIREGGSSGAEAGAGILLTSEDVMQLLNTIERGLVEIEGRMGH